MKYDVVRGKLWDGRPVIPDIPFTNQMDLMVTRGLGIPLMRLREQVEEIFEQLTPQLVHELARRTNIGSRLDQGIFWIRNRVNDSKKSENIVYTVWHEVSEIRQTREVWLHTSYQVESHMEEQV